MSYRPTCLWSFLVLSLSTVTCDVIYVKVGDTAEIPCPSYTGNDVSWTFNSQLIVRSAPMASRSLIIHGKLNVRNVVESDAGEYICDLPVSGKTQKTVITYKCSVHPTGPFLENDPVKIWCNKVGGAKAEWTCKSPSGTSYSSFDSGSFKETHVTLSDGGTWQCSLKENEQEINYTLEITIIGLIPSPNLTVQEGTSVVLPCEFYSNPKVTYTTWERLGPKKSWFLATEAEAGAIKWKALKPSGDFTNVKFSKEKLSKNFSVMLTSVKASQSDSYRCSVTLDNGRTIKHDVRLVVKGQVTAEDPGDVGDDGSGLQSKASSILGIDLWIWIAIGVGFVVLIILIIIAVIVYQKKKRIKRKARKMRSMKHALMPRNYCHCNRGELAQPNGKRREPQRTSEARSSREGRPAQQRKSEREGKVA